tara:strand:- start:1165 stop:1374 length:210 start_codon:yes stop_codon:yes gene_type:complete
MKIIKTIIFFYFITLTNANAYLDPATGSAVVAAVVAGFAAFSNYLKIFSEKIKNLFKIKKIKNKNKKNI